MFERRKVSQTVKEALQNVETKNNYYENQRPFCIVDIVWQSLIICAFFCLISRFYVIVIVMAILLISCCTTQRNIYAELNTKKNYFKNFVVLI